MTSHGRSLFQIFWAVVLLLACATAQARGANKPILAIFNLRPLSMDAMGYDGEILYSIICALDQSDEIRLMPRREIEQQLLQANLTQSDNISSVIRAGKSLGVAYILSGQVDKNDSSVTASFNLVNIASKKIVKSWKKSFNGHSEITNQGPKIARSIVRSIRSTSVKSSKKNTQNTDPRAQSIKVQGFNARCKDNLVILQWSFDTSDPISVFHVYRSQNPGGPFQCIGSSKKNSFIDAFVRKNKTYYYTLGATLHDGKTIDLKSKTLVRDVSKKVPHPPLIVKSNGRVQGVVIKCIPSMLNSKEKFKIKQYRLYRKEYDVQDWKLRGSCAVKRTSQSELAFYLEDDALEDESTYYYAITSVSKQDEESPFSEEVIVTTLPKPRLEIGKENLLRQTMLHWEPLDDVVGYYLYRRHGDKDWEKIARLKAAEREYVDDNDLEDGLTYIYALTAYDDWGETAKSNEVESTTKPVPDPPDELVATSGLVKSVKLTWQPIDDKDVAGYVIYRGKSRTDLLELAQVKGNLSDSYVDKGSYFKPVEDGTTYFYSIASFNLFKAVGSPALVAEATTKSVPVTPEGFMIQRVGTQIVLRWKENPESDIRGYKILRSHNGSSWANVFETGPTETTFSDHELRADTEYGYQLIAVDKDRLESAPAVSNKVRTAAEIQE